MRISNTTSLLAIASVIASATSISAVAQDVPPLAQQTAPATDPVEDDTEDDFDTIVVLGARLIGEVDTAQPPVLELDTEAIAAYGSGSIAELIESLGSQVNSSRGRGSGGGPVILVNGVRISSFREMRSYPPEAIEKLEVFTEEVAQQYGYSPDQRVVNLILKDNFSSREIEVEYGQPFRGGVSEQEIEATYLRLDGPSRLNFNVDWNNSSLLTESERGVVQADGATPDLAIDPDPTLYRSLVADSASLEVTGNWTTKLGQTGNSLSVNATFERDDSLSLQGLDSVRLTDPSGTSVLRFFNADDPLTTDRRSESYSGGATLNLGVGDWTVVATSDVTLSDSRTRTQRNVDTSGLVAAAAAGTLALDADLDGLVMDGGFDEANTDTLRWSSLATAQTNPLYLPAGDVSLTLDAGYVYNRIESTDTRRPGLETDLDRSNLQAGFNLGVPLTSRDDDFGGFIGDVSLSFSGGIEDLSDFGTLYDWSAGVTWGLTDTLTLNANYINRDEAPSLSQLGSPEIATANVPVFDLTNNETVLVTSISGGNPNLLTQKQSDWKFGLIWQLPVLDDALFTVDYFRNHSENVTGSLPTLTPAIEAAFPGRVTRDATGRLTAIDTRPVNFAEQDVERLQFGLNFSGQIAGNDESAGGTGGFAGGPGRGAPAGGAVGGRPAGGPAGGPQGGFGGGPNAEQFAALRAQFCEAEPDQMLDLMNRAVAAAANGEEPPLGPTGEPLTIPPQMLQRLTGDDGQIDPERFNAIRERICSADGPPQAGAGAGGPPRGAGGPPGGMRMPFMRGPGGGSGGRWFFNVQYQLDLDNTVLIAPGIPELDLLNGDALTGGGQAKHGVNARMGIFYNGFGFISFWNYSGKSRLDGSGLPGSTDLFYGDQLTINFRSFIDLERQESLVEAVPFFKGARIGFGMNNVFDSRQRVTDSNGDEPLRFQRFLLDPEGRSFEIEFRKLF